MSPISSWPSFGSDSSWSQQEMPDGLRINIYNDKTHEKNKKMENKLGNIVTYGQHDIDGQTWTCLLGCSLDNKKHKQSKTCDKKTSDFCILHCEVANSISLQQNTSEIPCFSQSYRIIPGCLYFGARWLGPGKKLWSTSVTIYPRSIGKILQRDTSI